MWPISGFLDQRLGLEFQPKRERIFKPKSKISCLLGIFEDSKGYNLINLRTNKSFIKRSVHFEEEPLAAVEVGESSLPPQPLIVSEETNEFDDSDMSDNDDLIAYPNIRTRQK